MHIGEDGDSDEQVVEMWNKSLAQITTEKWKGCVQHSSKVIVEWYKTTNHSK